MKRILPFCLLLFCGQKAVSQCSNLQLTSDKSFQCAPGIVKFVTSGAPTGSSYMWDFGSGYSSNRDTVYEFFIDPKIVDVDVIVTFPSGLKCQLSKKAITQILPKPTPTYKISRTVLCDGPDSVQITNTSKGSKSISWIIDGTNYSSASDVQIHYFKTVGKKNMSMVVTDSFGCWAVTVFKDVVDVYPDVLMDFYADNTVGCVTKEVNLSPTINSQGETITTYAWKFEGANILNYNGLTPPKIFYRDPGKFDLSLTAITSRGCNHTLLKSEYLRFGDSMNLDLKFSDTLICLKNEVVVKTDIDVEGDYKWSFQGKPTLTKIKDNAYVVKYDTPGKYKISLALSYNACYSSSDTNKTVTVNQVHALFESKDNYHCYTPLVSHLDNKSTHSNEEKLKYTWSYFDENGILLSSSNHINDSFSSPSWGKYDVQLIAEDMHGCKDTFSRANYIRVFKIQPDFISLEQIGCVDQQITLKNNTPPSSYISTDSFHWLIFDKNDSSILSRKSGSVITHQFKEPGFYSVKMFAGNTIGCIDSLKKENYIEIVVPQKGYSVSDTIICRKESITFESTTKPAHAPFQHSYTISNQDQTSQYHIPFDTTRLKTIQFDWPGIYDVNYSHRIASGCYDTIKSPKKINVNGVTGEVILDHWNGCDSMIVKPIFKVKSNVHVGNNSDELTYFWYITPKLPNNKEFDIYSENPSFQFNEKGTYTIYCQIFNSVRCVYDVQSIPIQVGVIAQFYMNKVKVCEKTNVELSNQSYLNPTSCKWNIYSKGDYNIDMISNPIIFTPKTNANYVIELVAEKNGQCTDTIRRELSSIRVKSEFQIADTHLYCAPAYAQFYALSQNADSFFWDFGDGNKINTTDIFIANIYERNTKNKNGFDVRLISKSILGCSDTLLLPNAVSVIGPVPEFSLTNIIGCEPLQVQFTDHGKGTSKFYLNYRDASQLDSIKIESHTYRITNSGFQQKYIPSIFAKDSLGCSAIFESKDTITVFKSPKAEKINDKLDGCLPFKIQLEDKSASITSRKWRIDNTELGSDQTQIFSKFGAGSHELGLVVYNSVGCSDTVACVFNAYEPPKISLSEIDYCVNQPAKIQASLNSNNVIKQWSWQLDYPVKGNVTSVPEWDMVFEMPGMRQVSVQAMDTNGCTTSTNKMYHIPSPDSIPSGVINFVSVMENNDLQFDLMMPSSPYIQSTKLYNENGELKIQLNKNAGVNIILSGIDLSVKNCYQVKHVDKCGDEGKSYTNHCPIQLTVSKGKAFELNLSWSPYVGWPMIDKYIIIRRSGTSKYEKIAEVAGNMNTYIDQGLCDVVYSYYVVAQYRSLKSESNRSQNQPTYLVNEMPVDVEVASVENNGIIVKWKPSTFASLINYRIQKWDSTANQLLSETILPPDQTSFTDYNVDVDKNSYIYFVNTIDHCTQYNPEGQPGKSMLLHGEYIDEISHLYWTPYLGWMDDVETYDIQLSTPEGYLDVGEVAGDITRFKYGEIHKDLNGNYCFRIQANSYNPDVTSLSNEICLYGHSKVWVPNAFTPNEDDLNSQFKPTLQFINMIHDGTYQEYEMKIYNRWGEEIFATHETSAGWDGTYKSVACPAQFYLYHIRVKGLDNVLYNQKGLIRLMR